MAPPFTQEQIDSLNELPRYLQPLGKAFNYTPADGGGDGLGDLIAAGGSGATALDNLTDVTLTAPANLNILRYDSGISQWINSTLASVAASALALSDLSDVTITAAANNDFLKFDSGTSQWIDFALFSTANTWLATQNVQHLIPNTNATFDLGTSAIGFRTLYTDNLGGVILQSPTAIGTGTITDYTIRVGGGASNDTEGGIFRLMFDGLPIAHTGSGNELNIDFGTGSLAADTSRLTITSDYTGVGVGPVAFQVSGSGFQQSFALFAPSLPVGQLVMSFRNTVGSIVFGVEPTSAASTDKPSIVFNDANDGIAGANPQDCFVVFKAISSPAFVKMDTEGISTTGAIALGREIRFDIAGGAGTAVRQRIESRFEVLGGGYVPFTGPSTNYTLDLDSSVTSYAFIRGGRPTGTAAAANPVGTLGLSLTTLATCYLSDPNIALGAFTLTNSAILYIDSVATEATNNYAIFVDTGTTRLDGNLDLAGLTGVRISATTAGVLTLAGFGNTNNENITMNFESVANTVTVGTGTGVTTLSLSAIATIAMASAVVSTNLDFNAAGDGVRLSGSTAGVLTMASVGNTNNENLTIDLETTANAVTIASGTGVTELFVNLTQTRVNEIEIDTALDHDGTTIGFFGTAPNTQQAGLATLTDPGSGTANNSIVTVAPGVDLTSNATINDNFKEVLDKINQIRGILNSYGLTSVV